MSCWVNMVKVGFKERGFIGTDLCHESLGLVARCCCTISECIAFLAWFLCCLIFVVMSGLEDDKCVCAIEDKFFHLSGRGWVVM